MDYLDLLIIALYFGFILWIAKWASEGKKNTTFSSIDYFLAGKNQGWLVIGASLIANHPRRFWCRSPSQYAHGQL
ncbi:MAG: hypothetical protein AAF399_04875 [Bacteroidota bacterium]